MLCGIHVDEHLEGFTDRDGFRDRAGRIRDREESMADADHRPGRRRE